MTFNFPRFGVIATAVLLVAAPQVSMAQGVPGNLRIVIGSTSTGGDTYQVSSMIAEALSEELGINARVDPVGATEGFSALERDTRGNTVMVFHDQSYLGNLYGVRGYDDIFENFRIGPTFAINPGNAYLTAKSSPYPTMNDVIEAAGAGEQIRIAIEPGGVSEIGFSAIKNAVAIEHPGSEGNIVAVNTGSQADKNQLLFDGQVEVIHGSVQANEQFTRLDGDDQTAMSFVWLTSRGETLVQANEEGMGGTTREELLEFAEPNVSVTQDGENDFTFDKEFFFIYNPEMSDEAVAQIDEALTAIFDRGEIQTTMTDAFFIPNFKPSEEAATYLKDKRDQYRTVIESIQ